MKGLYVAGFEGFDSLIRVGGRTCLSKKGGASNTVSGEEHSRLRKEPVQRPQGGNMLNMFEKEQGAPCSCVREH